MTAIRDNFSKQAFDYAQFRPDYPDEMIEYIVSFAKNRNAALDVATGNGQVAGKISRFFKTVYATDISASQLENAVQRDNIVYTKEPAEATSFGRGQFDLITVAQAVHWFEFDAFYKEVYRTLNPDGIFAVMGYGLFSTNPDSDRILRHYYDNIVGPYWDAERKYIDERYETIPFPFNEIETKRFTNRFNWTFEQLIGYLGTWSATQAYKDQKRSDPVDLILDDLQKSWQNGDKTVTFPLLLRIGVLKP